MKLGISVIILTLNEEKNIKDCLDSVAGWVDEIFIVDSGSTDKTIEIALRYTDKIYTQDFENFYKQRNWAQGNLPIKNEWVMHLDADERVSGDLKKELFDIFLEGPDADGFMIKRKSIFRGRWIRHGGHYPSYHLRLFKKDKGRSEERLYDQHYMVDGRTKMLKADIVNIINDDVKALASGYKALLEAKEVLSNNDRVMKIKFAGDPIEHINWLRYKIYYKAPLFIRPILYFLYRYILRLGFLDGAEGAVFHFYQGFWFRFLVDMKISELKRSGKW